MFKSVFLYLICIGWEVAAQPMFILRLYVECLGHTLYAVRLEASCSSFEQNRLKSLMFLKKLYVALIMEMFALSI